MVLRSKETGGDVELPDNGGFPLYGDSKIEIREGGTPATKDKTRIEIHPGFVLNSLISGVITGATIGILVGAGVVLPGYSWACIGILIGVINPIGRS